MLVSPAAVVVGATVVTAAPSIAAIVGRASGCSWTIRQPRPSRTRRTTARAARTDAGSHAGRSWSRRAGTTRPVHAPS
jgi:hypothetical protein